MTPPLRTVVIGCGKIGAGWADDPLTARHYPYATHAQVLADHPAFDWDAVVDTSHDTLHTVRKRWRIRHGAAHIAELPKGYAPDVAVIATPPAQRREILEHWPDLPAVVVEKPIADSLAESRRFEQTCRERGILAQVNLWRRADERLQQLAVEGTTELIGRPQAVFGVYGNGLLNNALHLVDLVRFLLGEITEARISGPARTDPSLPIPGDVDVPFSLRLDGGVVASLQPIDFAHYREIGLEIWGERGRLAIMNEGLSLSVHRRQAHRAMLNEHELESQASGQLEPTVGHAMYRLYDNLAAALQGHENLCAPIGVALESERIVRAILDIARPAHADTASTVQHETVRGDEQIVILKERLVVL